MNGRSDRPVLRVLEPDAAGHCEPDGGACTVPGAEYAGGAGGPAPAPEPPDAPGGNGGGGPPVAAVATQAGQAAAEDPDQEAGEVSGAVPRAFSRPTPV
ncbi:hypothetical protein GCM10027570_28490 [Streptomonospora sediminis]